MTRRFEVPVLALVCVLSLGLAGCVPVGDPTPSVSPRATDASQWSDTEAFAAAEATYRSYIAALNSQRIGSESDLDPKSYLTGSVLTAEVDTDSRFSEAQVRLAGRTLVTSIEPSFRSTSRVGLLVCLDYSDTRLLDADNTDITLDERASAGGLSVELTLVSGAFLISDSQESDHGGC